MSALPPKADIERHGWHVRFVSKADICIAAKKTARSPRRRGPRRRFRGTDVTEYLVEMGRSLRLDVGCPDHLTPFLGFLSHQLPEFSRRHRHGLAGKLGQTGLQLRVGQYRVHR